MTLKFEQIVISALNRQEVLNLGLSNEARETLRKAFMQQMSDVVKPEFQTYVRSHSCNRHDDCAAADEAAKAKGYRAASHCHDDECEDCFGS